MNPIWKISGAFAGWVSEEGRIYDSSGENIGFVDDGMIFSLDGHYIGEFYDEERVGKKTRPTPRTRRTRMKHMSIAKTPKINKLRKLLIGWDDPDF